MRLQWKRDAERVHPNCEELVVWLQLGGSWAGERARGPRKVATKYVDAQPGSFSNILSLCLPKGQSPWLVAKK